MLFRLRLYRLLLTIAVFLLPYPAFEIGRGLWAIAWRHVGRPALFPQHSQLVLVLISCFVWALISQHYKLTSVDELFREHTGAKGAFSSCIVTGAILLGGLYFTQNSLFPRGLFICCMIVLLCITVLLRALFRYLLREKFSS